MKAKYAPNVKKVADILTNRYHDFLHCNKKRPLENLIFIICSVQTNKANYSDSYRSLRRNFPKLQMLADAPVDLIASTLKNGGRQNQKAVTIRTLVKGSMQTFGRASLSQLKYMTDEECENFLIQFPWIGKKVARCVMMYPLMRKVFPVDTHVWKICCRMGWVSPTKRDGTCSNKDMDVLQEKIPPDLRLSLHVNMISLGREFCKAQNPGCSSCPIEKYCKKVRVNTKN